MKIISKTLENKFKVIIAEDNSHPLICLQLYVRMGSAWENKDESGYSHFTEHLVFKSTKEFPNSSIMERVSFLGGNINAYTEFDSTCYYITLPSEFMVEGLQLLQQLTRFSNFDMNDFDSEKKVIKEELKQFQNDPEDFFIEEVAGRYFKKNLYKNPIVGTKKSLDLAKHQDLLDFYHRNYVPNNCFLVVCGKLDSENMIDKINDYFGDWKFSELSKQEMIKEKPLANPELIEIDHKIKSNMLAFVLPDTSESNPDTYALSLAMKAFAIGKNSRLHTRLYNQEKLIDNVKLHSLSGKNDGISIILIMPKQKADLTRIIEVFIEELHNYLEFGLNVSEIDEVKKELIHYFRYSYEYVESIASSLGTEEIGYKYENFEAYPNKIRNLNKSIIDEVSQRYLKPEYLKIFKIGKGKIDNERVKAILENPFRKSAINNITGDYYQKTFANGAKLILKKVIGKPTVGISVTSEVSQLNETFKTRGLNLLTAGMLLYGNEEKNYKQFLNYCSTNGIHFGISPKSETTSINVKCFQETLPQCLQLLKDVILSPLFPKEHLDNLKQSSLSNFDRVKDYPYYSALKSWKEMMFGKKSNIINAEGTKTTVRGFTRNNLIQWYKEHYNPSDLTYVIAGDFDFSLIAGIVEQLFSKISHKHEKSLQRVIYQKPTKIYRKVNTNSDQAIINIGGFGCGFEENEKNTSFHVLSQILGGDMNSLLFDELREKRGLAYSVEFEFRSVRSFGYFLVSAIVDVDRQKEAIQAIRETLFNVKTKGITADQLEKTINYIKGQRLIDEESAMIRAQTISMLESMGLGYEYYLDRDKRLNNVSIDSIHAIAKEYFREDNLYTYILT